MKALLMHPDRDFDPQQALPANEADLRQDLELETLFRAMADQDDFLLEVARKAILTGLHNDVETVLYRQEIMKDCLANPAAARQLYDLAVKAIEGRRQHYFGFGLGHYPGGVLHGSLSALKFFMGVLKEIRGVARANADLTELQFRHGVLESAELGGGNEGVNYVLRKPSGKGPGWIR
ncbi:MAG: DNA mismatch repair protein MutS, partial [Betaproteobacteria bacterium]|nr:DNA mismatch repair protein MutS [Betaproteobacteria bacterium]